MGRMDEFVLNLDNFDKTLKMVDSWMKEADNNLDQIKNHSDTMTPEDRVSVTMELQERVMTQTEKFSDDVKYWAEYKTGIKEFRPWLDGSEKKCEDGLSKPTTLDEANAMFANVNSFDQNCLKHLKILESAEAASLKMTTHKEADDEVKILKDRYAKVKVVSDEWMKKADTLLKEWKLLDNTVNELNSWVAKDRGAEQEQNFSLEKMESTL